MEAETLWTALLVLAVICGGLIAFAFWPWTRSGRRQAVRRAIVIAGAVVVAALPAGLKLSMTLSEQSQAQASQDEQALAAFIARQNDAPATPSPASAATPASHPDMSLEAVTARLEQKLQSAPDDVNGWILLGRSYAALKNWNRATSTFQKTIKKWPDNTDAKVAYAESLMAEANGRVTKDAKQIFEIALSADPKNIRARYNLALYEFQNGNVQKARADWLSLANDLPSASPWRPQIQTNLNEASAKLGLSAPQIATASPAPSTSVPQGPTQSQVAAAQSMSSSERAAFIDSMVEGLKTRLESNPNDRDGWLRLGRSYGVLGRWADARDAYEAGLKHFPGDAELSARLEAAKGKS